MAKRKGRPRAQGRVEALAMASSGREAMAGPEDEGVAALEEVASMLMAESRLSGAWLAGEISPEQYFAQTGELVGEWKAALKRVRSVAALEKSSDAACAVAVAQTMLGRARRGEAWFRIAEDFAPGNPEVAHFREIADQLLPFRQALMRSREGLLRRLIRAIVGR